MPLCLLEHHGLNASGLADAVGQQLHDAIQQQRFWQHSLRQLLPVPPG